MMSLDTTTPAKLDDEQLLGRSMAGEVAVLRPIGVRYCPLPLMLVSFVQIECRGTNLVANASFEHRNLSPYKQAVWSDSATVTLTRP